MQRSFAVLLIGCIGSVVLGACVSATHQRSLLTSDPVETCLESCGNAKLSYWGIDVMDYGYRCICSDPKAAERAKAAAMKEAEERRRRRRAVGRSGWFSPKGGKCPVYKNYDECKKVFSECDTHMPPDKYPVCP